MTLFYLFVGGAMAGIGVATLVSRIRRARNELAMYRKRVSR